MKPEIKINAELDDADPRVCHLTAECDIASKGPPQPLLQKIIAVPGISGVRLCNGRTIIVEKTDPGNWQDVSKTLGQLIRDHLKGKGADPRHNGPKGHTKFGATLENLWACHRQCDRFAVKMKSELQRERKYALWALGVTSLFGLFCAEHFIEIVFGLLGGVAAGVGAYYTKRSSSPEREYRWVRSRALAEDAKSEAIKFLVRAEPYDKDDAVAKLAEKANRVRSDMSDIGEFEDLDKSERLKGLPEDWLSMDDYLLNRVKDQSDWYGRKSRSHHKDAERLKQYVVFFGIATAVLGATRVVVGQFPNGSPDIASNKYSWDQFEILVRAWSMTGIADAVKERASLIVSFVRFIKLLGSSSWIPVFTSLTGTVTTFHYQNRLDFQSLIYKQTRAKLEAGLAEWNDQVKDADKPARLSEYIKKFERILNQEHAQWIAEFDKGAPGAASSGAQIQAPPGVT